MSTSLAKVLIVEDEQYIFELYEVKLMQEGFEVAVATNGSEGFDMIASFQPHIVLLDVLMPDTDGFGLLEQLCKQQDISAVNVIIFSNLSQKDEIDRGLKLGAKEYIVKTSVTPSQLAERLKKYIAN